MNVLSIQNDRHAQLVTQTRRLVAQTFYGTLMRQVRNSPFKSEVFDGGRGGQVFGELLDQQLTDHMSRSSGDKLVNAIVRRFEKITYTNRTEGRTDVPAL